MALVMVLIIALNWPFRGEVGTTPEPFKAVQENIKVQQLACWGRPLAAGARRPRARCGTCRWRPIRGSSIYLNVFNR
jgi:hypothetical protein